MKIREILQRKGAEVATISPHVSIEAALGLLKERNIGAVVISTATNPVSGILSERDIVRSLADRGAAVLREPVSDNMTGSVVSCGPDEAITDAMSTMTARRFRHMPVVEGGDLVGIVSIGDLVSHRLSELEAEASDLKAYIAAG